MRLLDLTNDNLVDVFRRQCQSFLIGILSCKRLRDVIRNLLPTVDTFELVKCSRSKIFPSLRLTTSLTHLDLSYNEFGKHGVHLASIMASGAWKRLRVLNLEACKLTNESSMEIVKNLDQLPELRVLNMRDNSLKCEALGEELGDQILSLPFLEELLLSNAQLTASPISYIINGFRSCPNLTTIDFSRNSLDYYAKIRLANALHFLPKLKVLYVDHCRMDFEGVENLLKALLLHCINLKELRIGYNRFVSADMPKFADLVAANQAKEGIEAIRVALHGKITQPKKGEHQRNCAYPGCNSATCPAALSK